MSGQSGFNRNQKLLIIERSIDIAKWTSRSRTPNRCLPNALRNIDDRNIICHPDKLSGLELSLLGVLQADIGQDEVWLESFHFLDSFLFCAGNSSDYIAQLYKAFIQFVGDCSITGDEQGVGSNHES